jgi:hypothetical protein
MVPYDKVQISDGRSGYVDGNGYLRGIVEANILAAGRKVRDVMNDLQSKTSFERYQITQFAPRYIEIRGAIKAPGKYPYPLDEDWSIMDLIQQINEFSYHAERREFLLVRKSWRYQDAYIFIHGEALPNLEGMGGDELFLFASDLVLFPGNTPLVYVFGSVKTPTCFTFAPDATPTLKVALEHAAGPLKTAQLNNVQVYRVLRPQGRRVFTIDSQQEPDFLLEAWDVVYVPPQIPRSLVGNLPNK